MASTNSDAGRTAPHHEAVEWEAAARTEDHCKSLELEIGTLQEQIAVLEEGLPGAPGMERAALAKEIAAYRGELHDKLETLRHCREPRV